MRRNKAFWLHEVESGRDKRYDEQRGVDLPALISGGGVSSARLVSLLLFTASVITRVAKAVPCFGFSSVSQQTFAFHSRWPLIVATS